MAGAIWQWRNYRWESLSPSKPLSFWKGFDSYTGQSSKTGRSRVYGERAGCIQFTCHTDLAFRYKKTGVHSIQVSIFLSLSSMCEAWNSWARHLHRSGQTMDQCFTGGEKTFPETEKTPGKIIPFLSSPLLSSALVIKGEEILPRGRSKC